MSKPKRKRDNLPPLQKRIVLNLAENSPQTINGTARSIKSHYKPSWIAFKSIEEKGLVKKIGKKSYRGREYPEFWLTVEGVLVAMLEGASSIDLLSRVNEVYPENKILQYCLEVAPKLNPEVFRLFLSAIRSKGKLEPIDMATIFLTQMQTDTSSKTFKELGEILKKYPQEHSRLKKQLSEMHTDLDQIEKMI
jgi:hypothetical protein